MIYNFQKLSALVSPQGTIATCFHRTNTHTINGIFSEGFQAGGGQTYGEGLYTCFDLKSQLNPQMYHYGDIILEFKINISNFLNLQDDREINAAKIKEKIKNVEKIIYNKQMAETHDKVKQDTEVEKSNKTRLNDLLFVIEKGDKKEYTSDVAQNIYFDVMKFFDGMIFNGRRDGLVCVIYNYADNATPFRVRNGQTGEVIAKTITKEQKEAMIVMSIKEKLKSNPETFENFKTVNPEIFEKYADVLEEAQVVGYEERIKNEIGFYTDFPKYEPELFYKYKDRFKKLENESWIHAVEKQITQSPSHFKRIMEDLQEDYPEMYEKHKDRLIKKVVEVYEEKISTYGPDYYNEITDDITEDTTYHTDIYKNNKDKFDNAFLTYWNSILSANYSLYPVIEQNHPKFYNRHKQELDKWEELSITYWSQECAEFSNGLLELKQTYPEFFKKHQDRFEKAILDKWIEKIKKDPKNLMSFMKTYKEIYAKHAELFVGTEDLAAEAYVSEIKNPPTFSSGEDTYNMLKNHHYTFFKKYQDKFEEACKDRLLVLMGANPMNYLAYIDKYPELYKKYINEFIHYEERCVKYIVQRVHRSGPNEIKAQERLHPAFYEKYKEEFDDAIVFYIVSYIKEEARIKGDFKKAYDYVAGTYGIWRSVCAKFKDRIDHALQDFIKYYKPKEETTEPVKPTQQVNQTANNNWYNSYKLGKRI